MALLKLDKYQLHYGEQVIFDSLELILDPGDRLCIIGRNGVGKSTLLKCIQGEITPDSGERWLNAGTKVASLSQDLPDADDTLVFDMIANAMPELGADIVKFNALVVDPDPDLNELERVQQRIEAADGWNFQNKIEQVLTRLNLDGTAKMRDLSGGWRRRVALGQALVVEPDVLLLDEPTNHLDIEAIRWLEEQLLSFAGALVFITHDRAFLRSLSNKIGELDRGALTCWKGTYDGFLTYREEMLAVEEKHNALFDKRLAQEEVWIRQGIKARRTRNEGRVRALKDMRNERAARRNQLGKAKIEHNTDTISGKLVCELNHVSFGWDNNKIIEDFSSIIVRGDKIGLIGPNGIGKSTLLKLILGDIEPNNGEIKMGTKLTVAYFDQLRDQLDLEKSAIDNIGQGRDSIEINGRSKHVISYMQDFLFSGERARTPIKALSGGEKNRVLLAKMFSKPSNLLIMDEPTNDLDVETLELLESLLTEYQGTLFLVSHDRAFLDNVVTSSIAFEGNGTLREYVGGYSDWLEQGGQWPEDNKGAAVGAKADKSEASTSHSVHHAESKSSATTDTKSDAKPKKLSYKLQAELDKLPALVEKLEVNIAALHKEIADPDFYSQPKNLTNKTLAKLEQLEAQNIEAYARWEELENM